MNPSKRMICASLSFTLVLALLVAGAAGCTYSFGPKEDSLQIKYVIGLSQANLGEPWRVEMNREIQAEAAKHPDIRVIFLDAAQNSAKQIDDVKRLLKRGIDLLIISPNEAKPLTSIVREAYLTIPVIVLDREIEGDDYTLFIGADNRLIGKQAGEFALQLLGEKGGNIVEIQGLQDSTPAADRSIGFHEAITGKPGIRIIDQVRADWLRDKAEDRMKEAFGRLPAVDLIYAHNDPMALGAYLAAKEMGRTDIQFVGIDGLPGLDGGIQLVNGGKLQATFIYPTGGKEAIQYALKILDGNGDFPKRISLGTTRITADNVAEFMYPHDSSQ
jgi:ABC-type sugar transport system substrate-binding protein